MQCRHVKELTNKHDRPQYLLADITSVYKWVKGRAGIQLHRPYTLILCYRLQRIQQWYFCTAAVAIDQPVSRNIPFPAFR